MKESVPALFRHLHQFRYSYIHRVTHFPRSKNARFPASSTRPESVVSVNRSRHRFRRQLDARLRSWRIHVSPPEGMRDRTMFAVLAYTGCRVGELCRLRVSDYKETGGHKVLEVRGKGGKERRVPLHPEAFEALELWLDTARLRGYGSAPLF